VSSNAIEPSTPNHGLVERGWTKKERLKSANISVEKGLALKSGNKINREEGKRLINNSTEQTPNSQVLLYVPHRAL
jgi:hypothetical protein